MSRPKIAGIRTYISLSLLVILIGGIVFTTGFGICLYLSRTQITELTNKGISRDLDVIHNYVDGQLQSIEDVAYALSGAEDRNYATFDPASFDSEESMFVFLENILNVNANICGIAIGLEPSLSVPQQGPYGFAAYVTNVSGKSERLRLGGINDYRKRSGTARLPHATSLTGVCLSVKPIWAKSLPASACHCTTEPGISSECLP